MPNFDGGHYFLTALIPIKSAEYVEQDGRKNSPVHMVRNALAVLPKARQSPVTEQTGFNSPFARNTRTHFARLFVIDDVINNGRNPVNALKVAIGSRLGQASAVRLNPTTQQPYDQLSQPYLVFVADFDASSGDDGAAQIVSLRAVANDAGGTVLHPEILRGIRLQARQRGDLL